MGSRYGEPLHERNMLNVNLKSLAQEHDGRANHMHATEMEDNKSKRTQTRTLQVSGNTH